LGGKFGKFCENRKSGFTPNWYVKEFNNGKYDKVPTKFKVPDSQESHKKTLAV
jgi:hypothetical protein